MRRLFRALHDYVRDLDWRALVGTTLVMVFIVGVVVPAIRMTGHHSAQLPTAYGAGPAHSGETFWQRTFTDPVAFYTLVLAGFTVVLALSTIMLWWQTRRLAQGAEEQTRMTVKNIQATREMASAAKKSAIVAETDLYVARRAYIIAEGIGLAPDRNAAGDITQFSVRVVWKNAGQTPATRTNQSMNYMPMQDELPQHFTFPDIAIEAQSTVGVSDIGAGSIGQTGDIAITSDEILAIWNRRLNAYIWAWIEYSDVFSGTPRRRTEYCAKVIVLSDPTITPFKGLEFLRVSKFNGIDSQCLQQPKTT